jgi:hypothetical protein
METGCVFNKIISGSQLRQMNTRLIGREDFIESCRRESFRSYECVLPFSLKIAIELCSELF